MKGTHIALALAAVLAAAGPASAESVSHVPPSQADAGEALALNATVDRAWESTITLHFRGSRAGGWATAEFRRDGERWVAIIPAENVQAPGVEYYIDAVSKDGQVVPQFASATDPHVVLVRRQDVDVRRDRELARYDGKRSRLRGSAEWVDFGERRFRVDGETRRIPDRYYRLDADFSYLLLAYPLKAVRIGFTQLLGETPDTYREDPLDCGADPDCEIRAGFKVGGWTELRFSVMEGVEADARGSVMATKEGFKIGGRTELRVGVEDGSHVALGAEILGDVGTSAFFRLGWDTVPQAPMTATVEMLDYPADHRAAGVRLIYDVAHPFPGGLRIGARASYQARDERVGGLGGGLTAAMDF